jgi:hypothetical protein
VGKGLAVEDGNGIGVGVEVCIGVDVQATGVGATTTNSSCLTMATVHPVSHKARIRHGII